MNRCECPTQESLGCLTNLSAMAARNFLTRQLALNGIDMTIEQFKVMVVLWKEKSSTQQNIADFVGKDKTSITRLIAGLEKRSLIQRATACQDKRCNLVTLTPQGSALEKPTMEVLKQANESLQRHFNPEELAITLRVLKQMCLMLNYTQKESE
ncbi:MAG: MarR family winged helix-turn-helix transcriptional regulator [Sulfuricurvum sp.]|uniref:MarR family winged helix-turn-helix transcriptional regulator n=1 Tax=Sulfuricurvum sp. TaxID=2025608 RepID=UPI00271A03E6|nr:MarR family winged helix-turn-helix transcriptional regulator [Sulfuricurvum sp.]MDO9055870.1 MarR family winged helix-turn-helix transcriptional regulator [Sulfuricurvum sp.]MDP2851665.1 MarR family winged helix-turn-helix transcriptional regulator [Sulfuricurvum sp.]MDP3290587.1 MarR family winged helix-turn-helix transcriptional regulator [Sulfuricurvum sp.]